MYYTLYFTSIITPYKINNIRLIFYKVSSKIQIKTLIKKLFIKQSYLILTWFWYIQLKNNVNKILKPSFVFKPTKKYKITLLKAPMAHKTFSQEQIKFQYFSLTISFKINMNINKINFSLNTLNKVLVLLLQLRQTIPFIETNFFILTRFKFSIYLRDKIYFIFYE